MAIKSVMHRVAFVDLDTGKVTYEDPGDEAYEKYLGGYGLGAYILYTRQRAGVDALAPEAMLGLLTGPLTGTDAITGNRFVAVGKSPKTGTWGDANCGGYFGPALKEAGLDGVFFTGTAQAPTYALVQDGEVTLHSAADYWGLDTVDTEDKFRDAYGKKARVACIGPAGERVSALAAIINDGGRAAGRSGLGMVMGAKKLKAVVAVASGSVEVADADGLKAVRQRVLSEYYKAGNPSYELFSNYGTCGITAGSVQTGDAPVKNWSGTVFDFPEPEKISDDAVIATQTRKYGCWRCPLACGGHVKIEEGPYAVEQAHKPEYETLAAFGSMCLNDSLAAITKCNDICNRMGMDTIATGTTVAFAIECYERGIITKQDTGGLELTWGNHAAIVAVTEQMGNGTGFGGEILGDGMKAAVARIGPEAAGAAMHCGGEELPMHDPRLSPGIGASFVIDATPGRHTQYGSWLDEAVFLPPDLGQPKYADKYVYTGKGENGAYISRWGHVVNAAGLCMFGCTVTPAPAVPEFLTKAMGVDFTMDTVQEVGGRIAALRTAFNLREGVRNVDFKLPRRVLGDPPLEKGDTAGVTVDNLTEIKEYCVAMGWDPETGVPEKTTLEALGLDFVVQDLHG